MQLAEDINFTTEKKELLSEKIHDEILELIIKNASEEEQVLNEKRLVELFGVSKAPVREALIKLCSEGVLRNVPRYGYVVVKMKEKDARDITKLRCILETEALKAGFDNIIQYHLPDIKAHIDNTARMQQEPVDVWGVWEDNEQFHLLLASYADNQLLMKFLKESLGIQKRIYAQFSWNKKQSMDDCFDEEPHVGIYRALQDKDLDRALELLRRDVASSLENRMPG